MEFGKGNWRTFEQGIQKEWLLTNGIGGFSSSTIIGANSRRYHGLLVASLRPPVKRHLILSKIDESIVIDNKTYNLYSSRTPDHTMKGYLHLQRVVIDPLPVFIYNIGNVYIEKKISMVYGENTVTVVYHIMNGGESARLRLTPLVNFRDYHFDSKSSYLKFAQKTYERGTILTPSYYDIDINIYCSDGRYTEESECYFYNMFYEVERERGLYPVEDHFIPGCFDIDIRPGEDKYITLIASVEKEMHCTDGAALIKKEEERVRELVRVSGFEDGFAQRLAASADSFIVDRKSTGAKTVIAGYPWFTDWGRDTMIAIPGLTLATGRFDDAREILKTFALYVKDGLVPNMFPDEGQEPGYNSVDAALWFFEAVAKFIRYTGDYSFIQAEIYEALREIVTCFIKGTHFKIRMDDDGLITAGDRGTQLTWMDAKIGDWVVTPRHGKAVEINALWYNALRVMAVLAKEYGEDGKYYILLAEDVINSFEKVFWNEDGMYLYDVITDEYKDVRVRPNQILSVSLTYPVMSGEKAVKIVERVWSELYTAYGLRSLTQKDDEYKGVYEGDQYRRDSAYHQGTVWTWPLGHFITAFVRVHGNTAEGRQKAAMFINPFRDHLKDACIGYISEIFDGDEPLIPRGCFAQAWSVAEILRAYVEDVLQPGTKPV